MGLTVEIVAAYVSNNSMAAANLAELISSVHLAVGSLGKPSSVAEPAKRQPPVSIKKSITPDYLISMEDGRHYKSLKRHLSGRGLTPAEYKTKWGLPADYPMTAPSYAARRSELAKAIGLGQSRRKPTTVPTSAKAAGKRGGKPKAAA